MAYLSEGEPLSEKSFFKGAKEQEGKYMLASSLLTK